MAELHLVRHHGLGLLQARRLAADWAEQAENRFDMDCSYQKGRSEDLLHFSRSGVQGELQVTPDRFELNVRLGFLLGAFKDRIEGEIVKMLDSMLPRDAAAARPSAKKPAARKP
ncbi:MAG: polyhydroxyalkanoic acid system family protein [Burkholderiaceae bacterium]